LKIVLRIKPLIGNPDFINIGVNRVPKETIQGFCMTVKSHFALFKSVLDLYAKAFSVLFKDRFMLTFIRIANIGSICFLTKFKSLDD
jgi:hypothetical protein